LLTDPLIDLPAVWVCGGLYNPIMQQKEQRECRQSEGCWH
jgi:hypothetical protein